MCFQPPGKPWPSIGKNSFHSLITVFNNLHKLAQTDNDDLSSVLSSDDLSTFPTRYPNSRSSDFPPVKTLTLFMRQVASDTKACRHALIDNARDQTAMDKNPSNTHTSAYYKARKRLTEASVKGLMCQSGTNLDKASSDSWLCHHRRVLLTDANFKKLLSGALPD